jgi:glycosyl transferase family 25
MSLLHLLRNARRYARTVRQRSTRPGDGPLRQCGAFPIYVINLERSEHRRRFALNHLTALGLQGTIFPAVDGRSLGVEELEREGIYREEVAREKFSRSLSRAEIGCTLSHLRLHDMFVRSGADVALVLEDDAMLVDDAHSRLPAIMAELPDDWDLVQLIYACTDFEHVRGSIVRFRMHSSMPVSSSAYLIRRSGAAKMLNNGYPVRYPADSLIGRSPRWDVKVYGVQPQLATINNVFPSSIYTSHSLRARLGANIKASLVHLLGSDHK